MQRIDTWESALEQHIHKHLDLTFQWGVVDCSMFVCDAILAITGIDVGEEFRGKYDSALSAAKVIKQITGTGITVEDAANYVTSKYNMPVLSTPKLAQRGDVVLFDGEEGPALGIVALNGRDALFVTEKAMRRIPLSECRAAWRV